MVIRNTLCLAVAGFGLAGTAFAQTGVPEGPDCGPPITVGEVRVVDTESEDAAASMLGFGAEYRVLNGVWPFPTQGSRVQTVNAATRWAASHGCPLLYVGVEVDAEDTWSAVGNSAGRNNAPSTPRRYATLRVGVAHDTD